MAINLDKALGIHPQTLDFRVERSKVLASNLINAETPGYKARDLDFKAAMKQVEAGMQMNQQYSLAYRMQIGRAHV